MATTRKRQGGIRASYWYSENYSLSPLSFKSHWLGAKRIRERGSSSPTISNKNCWTRKLNMPLHVCVDEEVPDIKEGTFFACEHIIIY